MAFSQFQIQDKFELFLSAVGRENLADFAGGLCNAFSFFHFRAACYGL
jgi:hypothetical protein